MAGLGLVVIWTGYLLFAYGYVFAQGAPVKLSDMALPTRRSTVIAAMQAAAAGGTTGGLPGGSAEKNLAIQQATADMNAACGADPTSSACKAARQRLANIQSVGTVG